MSSSSLVANQLIGPIYGWQAQAGLDGSWTDYGPEETLWLESAWTIQRISPDEVVIALHQLEGLHRWAGYLFFLGNRLQQVNEVTGTSRTMRRIIVVQQGYQGAHRPPMGFLEAQDGQQLGPRPRPRSPST